MISYEKLSNDNFDKFNILYEESKMNIEYQLDFYKFYDNKGFLYKYFIKKSVKLLKYRDKYIGYIWIDNQNNKSIRINSIYVKEEYMDGIYKNILRIFKSNIIIYEVFENSFTLKLNKALNMSRYKITNLMYLKVSNYNFQVPSKISFRIYNSKTDRKLRCSIQNLVFRNKSRIPLTISDIEYDENQEYYINDLCIFIIYENTPIGYGQIVFSRGIYSIVNIGVLDKYRCKGYGNALIQKLINLAYEYGIEDLYIRVEDTNIKAKVLYENIGFKNVGIISSWLWNKV